MKNKLVFLFSFLIVFSLLFSSSILAVDTPINCQEGYKVVYQHPSKTCSNGVDTCSTPAKANDSIFYTQDISGTAAYGCSFGYATGSSYCYGNSMNGRCPASLAQGSFDFAEARSAGVHEDALLCYPKNIGTCVPITTASTPSSTHNLCSSDPAATNYCECDSSKIGNVSENGYICVTDKWGSTSTQYVWLNATSKWIDNTKSSTLRFKIYDLKSATQNYSIISNGKDLYYCNAQATYPSLPSSYIAVSDKGTFSNYITNQGTSADISGSEQVDDNSDANTGICQDVDNCLLNEDSSTSSGTQIEAAAVVDQINTDDKKSSSFICYQTNGVNNFAECCKGNCKNKDGVKSAYGIRTFGNGANIRSIVTYDNFNTTNPDILNNNFKIKKFDGTTQTLTLINQLPSDIKNIVSFNSLSFDIMSNHNITSNFSIRFYNNDVLFSDLKIENFISYNLNGVWHRVRIPQSSLVGLNSVTSIEIYYSGPATNENYVTVAIDNVNLDKDNYYCSSDGEKWIIGLNPPPSATTTVEKDIYKSACNGIRSFGWTGNKCCGYVPGEYYNDSEAGCFNGYKVFNDTTVKETLNKEEFNDLLFVNENQDKGSFYQCSFSQNINTESICNVKPTCDTSKETEVLEMSSNINAHAAKPGHTQTPSYQKLCCNTSKLNQISSSNQLFLSGNSNAHVSATKDAVYTETVTIGKGDATKASCSLTPGNQCPSGYSSLFSTSSQTNAHIAEAGYYEYNYCCGVSSGVSLTLAPLNLYSSPAVITKGACEIEGNHVCDNGNNWREMTQDDLYTTVNGVKKMNVSKTYTDSISMNNDTSPIGCCAVNHCWNGTSCVNGLVNFSQQFNNAIPDSEVYEKGIINKTDFGVVCSLGNWNISEKKYSPFHDHSGYCPLDSQCFYADSNGNNRKCYFNGAIVNDTLATLSDFMCSSGNWTSRTKLLADALYNVNTNGKPYSIFCDDMDVQKSINQFLLNQSDTSIDISNYAASYNEGSNSEKSICVLSIDGNSNGVFGDSTDDNVIIGIGLSKDWKTDPSAFNLNFGLCNPNTFNNNYVTCQTSDFKNKFYYNNATNSILFSMKTISFKNSNNALTLVFNWIKSFLGFKNQFSSNSAFTGSKKYEALLHAVNSSFKSSDILSNHMYYYTDSKNPSKEIFGIKEYKFDTSSSISNYYNYFIYVNYKGYNLSLCDRDPVSGDYKLQKGLSGASSSTKLTCSVDNSTVMMILDPADTNTHNDYWADFTARVRSTGPYVTPKSLCYDESINLGESDLNCGGPCAKCSDGLKCKVNADCDSNYCGATNPKICERLVPDMTVPTNYTINIVRDGAGVNANSVSLSDGTHPIGDCPSGTSSCSFSVNSGSKVIMAVTTGASVPSVLWTGCEPQIGWSNNDPTCTVTMNAAKTVTATFNYGPVSPTLSTISIIRVGNGANINSVSLSDGTNPIGDCYQDSTTPCLFLVNTGSNIIMAVTTGASVPSVLWTGCESRLGWSNTDPTCTVTMNTAKSVTAMFTQRTANQPSSTTGNPATISSIGSLKADNVLCHTNNECTSGTCNQVCYTQTSKCPSGWQTIQNKDNTYICLLNFADLSYNWNQARSYCTVINADLPTIEQLNNIPCDNFVFNLVNPTQSGTVKTLSGSSSSVLGITQHTKYHNKGVSEEVQGCTYNNCGTDYYHGDCNTIYTTALLDTQNTGFVCVANPIS